MRNMLVKKPGRYFDRGAKVESRVFCRCGLCRLRFGRMFLPVRAIRSGSLVVLSNDYHGLSLAAARETARKAYEGTPKGSHERDR